MKTPERKPSITKKSTTVYYRFYRRKISHIWKILRDGLDDIYDIFAPIILPLTISSIPFILLFLDNGQVSEILQILFSKDDISIFGKGFYLIIFGLFFYFLTLEKTKNHSKHVLCFLLAYNGDDDVLHASFLGYKCPSINF